MTLIFQAAIYTNEIRSQDAEHKAVHVKVMQSDSNISSGQAAYFKWQGAEAKNIRFLLYLFIIKEMPAEGSLEPNQRRR